MIPKKAEIETTRDIQDYPTDSKAEAIEVEGSSKFSSLATP